MRRLEFNTFVPGKAETIWNFFSSPGNLSKITPPGMGFNITSPDAGRMYEGMIITYKVAPLAGIPLTWVTEITHIRQGEFFIDEQRLGPYKIWHHEHHFRSVEGGVEMKDILYHHIGWGIIGHIADMMIVKKKVMEIFRFREKKIKEIFPE